MESPIDIQAFFKTMVELEASDLYLTVARPPMYRVDGKIEARGEHLFKPEDLKELAHGMLNEKQRGEFAQALEMNMAMSLPGIARFRVNMFQQRGSVGMVIRRIKADVHVARGDGAAVDPSGYRHDQARFGAGRRRHRLGQIDFVGGDDRSSQRQRSGPYHHHRRSDRVCPPP